MLGSILTTPDLLAITGYERPGDAARCLRREDIRVFEVKDGPWTTLELINARREYRSHRTVGRRALQT